MRAGGELSRGEHAVDREFAVDEFVQGADPHFAWVIHKAPKNAPEPPQTAGAMMRLLFSRGDSRMYVDAVPRSSSAAEGYAPKVNVVTDDSAEGLEARRLMADLLESGGRVRLRSGVSLALDRLPKPFGDMLTEPLTGDLTVKAVPMAEPWYAQLEVQSDLGRGGLEVDLVPVDPPDEWDSEWRGSRAGLSMEIRARWSVNDGRGETGLKLHYRAQPAPNADRVAALQAMVALHGTGSMRVVDRTGSRTTMETPIEGRPVPTELVELLGLAEALSEIERYSGRPAPAIPEETTLAEIDGLKRVAQTLRGGGEMVRLQDATLTGDHTMVERIRRSGSDIEIREKAFVRVFGREISIGERVMKLPLMKVKEARRTGRARDDPWDILLVPVHAEEVEVWMEFLSLAARDPKGPTPSTTEDQARD